MIITQLFVEASVIQEKLGLSNKTLQALRRERAIIQGIHYSEINAHLIVYNLPLMIDWVANRNDPDAHLLATDRDFCSARSDLAQPNELRSRHNVSLEKHCHAMPNRNGHS